MLASDSYGYVYWFLLVLRATPQVCRIRKYRHNNKTAIVFFMLVGSSFAVQPFFLFFSTRYSNYTTPSEVYYAGTPVEFLLSAGAYFLLLLAVTFIFRKLKYRCMVA